MIDKFKVLAFLIFFIFILSYEYPVFAAEITVIPSVSLRVEYDDNIDFNSNNEIDDFSGSIIPGLAITSKTELLELSAYGELDFKRYYDETDFDRTNQLYGFDGRYQMLKRLYFLGNFSYRKDESIDSQLEETGRVFERDRRKRYDAGGGFRYQISELSEIGPNFEYEKTNFSSKDNDDYDLYLYSLPYTRNFKNQRDTLILTPSFAKFESDVQEADGYRMEAGWKHLFSETITSNISAGARYTKIDRKDRNDNDNNWGGVGKIELSQNGETFSGLVGYLHDLRADTDGEIIQLDRIYMSFDKKIIERFGIKFYGSGYYSRRESGDNDNVRFFELRPSLYYLITENHSLELFYNYQNEVRLDDPGNPTINRNRVGLNFSLGFPKTW
jgi:hypothetical protein